MLDRMRLEQEPISERDAMMMQPVRLAYLGDAVHSLLVRTNLLFSGEKAQSMHRKTVQCVNAGAQAKALERIQGMLTEIETDVVRRGRNAHSHHSAPKNADPADYAQATALEALLGFLYLTGKTERLYQLYMAMADDKA